MAFKTKMKKPVKKKSYVIYDAKNTKSGKVFIVKDRQEAIDYSMKHPQFAWYEWGKE